MVSLVAAGGLAIGVLVGSGGGSPRLAARRPPPTHSIVLRGNGLGNASFGQAAPTAIKALRTLLGAPKTGQPVSMAGNCTIDSALEWRTMTAYFFRGAFVGYATGSLLGGPGSDRVPDVATSAGLRIGDPLTRAARIYGASLRSSYAQGGSWFVATPTGAVSGYLTSEVNSTEPAPRIADITAGSVGCPAASP